MPVIRTNKDKDFTVMSIHHLRDTRLPLKAIGLFSIILSLLLKRKFYFNFVSFPPFPTFSAKSHALSLHFRTTYPCGQNPRKETEKERFTMASKNSNQINVPQAREAMDKFKMQAAQEMGVNLKQGYNGDLTSREAGSVGGQMVKKMWPVRSASYPRPARTAIGHKVNVRYIASVTI